MRWAGKGFTLIELLVVIAIIAILAAILFPVYARLKDKANQTVCLNNTNQIVKAFRLYYDDWEGLMPPCVGYVGWKQIGPNSTWTERASPYMNAHSVFHCPADYHNYSYSMNARAMAAAESQIKSPAKFIVLFECPGAGVKKENLGGPNPTTGDPETDTGDADLTNESQTDGQVYAWMSARNDAVSIRDVSKAAAAGKRYWHWLYFPGRHAGGNMIGFIDGHIKWFRDWDAKQMTFQRDVVP